MRTVLLSLPTFPPNAAENAAENAADCLTPGLGRLTARCNLKEPVCTLPKNLPARTPRPVLLTHALIFRDEACSKQSSRLHRLRLHRHSQCSMGWVDSLRSRCKSFAKCCNGRSPCRHGTTLFTSLASRFPFRLLQAHPAASMRPQHDSASEWVCLRVLLGQRVVSPLRH